jgi:RNA polymerase sigma factor, sigma-70 family
MRMATPSRIPWDCEIQQRLVRGEEAALGELYDQFSPLVHGLANRVLDSQAGAELITREVFGYVWEHPDAFDPAQGSMRSWIGTLTHRRAVERLRRRSRPSAVISQDFDGDPCIAPESSSAAEEVLAAATTARAQDIVTSLPRTLRETLTLTYFGGCTYREAARELGIAEATARHRMRLGLQLLANALAMEHNR